MTSLDIMVGIERRSGKAKQERRPVKGTSDVDTLNLLMHNIWRLPRNKEQNILLID